MKDLYEKVWAAAYGAAFAKLAARTLHGSYDAIDEEASQLAHQAAKSATAREGELEKGGPIRAKWWREDDIDIDARTVLENVLRQLGVPEAVLEDADRLAEWANRHTVFRTDDEDVQRVVEHAMYIAAFIDKVETDADGKLPGVTLNRMWHERNDLLKRVGEARENRDPTPTVVSGVSLKSSDGTLFELTQEFGYRVEEEATLVASDGYDVVSGHVPRKPGDTIDAGDVIYIIRSLDESLADAHDMTDALYASLCGTSGMITDYAWNRIDLMSKKDRLAIRNYMEKTRHIPPYGKEDLDKFRASYLYEMLGKGDDGSAS